MFTGIIKDVGRLAAVEAIEGDARLRIAPASLDFSGIELGDSIAVNGVCLTVAELFPGEFCADVSRETLAVTTLGDLVAGAAVNLEPALTLADSLGGHLVSGHVDGVGRVASIERDARSSLIGFDVPDGLSRYVALKGSVAIDGTSLTVNEVAGSRLFVNIVPHTSERTIMGSYREGTAVNIEVDMIARYLERLTQD